MRTKPEEIRFGARYTVSKIEYRKNPERVMAMAEEHLRFNLAHYVQKEKARKVGIEDEELFELRLDLYVATPEKFWEIVNREAIRLSGGQCP